MRLIPVAFCLALNVAAGAARAADPPAGPPDDLDALTLADKAPAEKPAAASPWRIFIEGATGQGTVIGNPLRVDSARASLDLRYDGTLAPGLRAVLSNRLDLTDGAGNTVARDANTLREAYLSWARTPDQLIDIGRVNLRHGAAFGYNPTDWFKENALRSIVSPDPAVLRESRLGTFVLQGQQLWPNAALTAAFSPKLGRAPNPATFALDAGATNPRSRWLLAGSYKINERLNPELLAYGGAGTPTQLGLNLSGLVGDAAVVFAEFASGRGRSLAAQALGAAEVERAQRRASLGVTYTTPFNLSVTLEGEYNSAGPDRAQWFALPAGVGLRLLGASQALQDLPVRRAAFVHATWKDAVVRRLDLSAFVRREGVTSSRSQWLEARYRWDRADLSLQWQGFSGAPGSVYEAVPQRRSVELVLRGYL